MAGEEYKEAPDSLYISWYSFVENKYYEGGFNLNYKLLDSLFNAGFQSNHGHVTYDGVKVGMAPGGVVVVWVDGDRFQTEVGRYQAKETQEFNWKQMFPELAGTFEKYRQVVIKGMPQKVQQQIATQQITYGLWDKWRQRHNWRPVFTVPGSYEVEVTYFNKDREDLLPPQLGHMPYLQLAVPERMDILWLDDKKAHRVTTFTFNEAESYQLFGQIKPGQKADLAVELNPTASTMTIMLKTGGQELPFLKQELATVNTD